MCIRTLSLPLLLPVRSFISSDESRFNLILFIYTPHYFLDEKIITVQNCEINPKKIQDKLANWTANR